MKAWVPATLAAATIAVLAPPAFAHGPCGCLTPELGDTGVRVRIARTTAFKVIFNPTPVEYGGAMRDAGYASAYQPTAPTATVLSVSRNQRKRNRRFRVPDVPPGVYLVLIFDGSEGGQHKTWDYFHVLGPPPETLEPASREAREPASATDGPRPARPDTAVLAGLALGLAALAVIGRIAGAKRRAANANAHRSPT
jgi:hypothetical protein